MKQKTKLTLIITLALCLCVALGFAGVSVSKSIKQSGSAQDDTKNSKITNQSEIISDNQALAENEGSNVEKEQIILSKEDKAVKSEIAKHSNTKVDFRNSRQETIQNKKFNLTFEKIDDSCDYERVIYKNDSCDEFAYNTDNGKLRYAVIGSAVTEKTAQSINKDAAEKIAKEYVADRCKTGEYALDRCKETEKGYYFNFVRQIGGYPSFARYSVQIGYDGSVIYLNDFTDIFGDKNINYDKAFIDAKIKQHTDETKVNWDSVTVCFNINDETVAVSYTTNEDGTVAILPLED